MCHKYEFEIKLDGTLQFIKEKVVTESKVQKVAWNKHLSFIQKLTPIGEPSERINVVESEPLLTESDEEGWKAADKIWKDYMKKDVMVLKREIKAWKEKKAEERGKKEGREEVEGDRTKGKENGKGKKGKNGKEERNGKKWKEGGKSKRERKGKKKNRRGKRKNMPTMSTGYVNIGSHYTGWETISRRYRLYPHFPVMVPGDY
ncbi:hypothetical protein P167DRAFT_608487 [Morchella conica CCBAS932]|uniref:Uncharacterized protein n=1 Tax=Morchella conica CCBAS932 TaxID=1392247 RepID=A0A3N4KSM5_9PEZI|nr:hypothetical protein P167DRAFT_608487 [Morchella conica CCBAS932]